MNEQRNRDFARGRSGTERATDFVLIAMEPCTKKVCDLSLKSRSIQKLIPSQKDLIMLTQKKQSQRSITQMETQPSATGPRQICSTQIECGDIPEHDVIEDHCRFICTETLQLTHLTTIACRFSLCAL